jgi:hypothetical protein
LNTCGDFSFINGGVVPGVLILPPDYPENREDWPFLSGEIEYVINLAAAYIFLVNAANSLAEEGKQANLWSRFSSASILLKESTLRKFLKMFS